MVVVRKDLWLCQDCTCVACNGDDSGVPANKLARQHEGLEALGPHLVPDFNAEASEGVQEYTSRGTHCDVCGFSMWAMPSYRFAVLGEEVDAS